MVAAPQVPKRAGQEVTLRILLRRYLIAVSFVNLCYAAVWKRLLDISRPALFTVKTLPGRGEYIAAICGVLLGGLIVVAVDAILRPVPRVLRACALAASVAFLVMRGQALFPEQLIPTLPFLFGRAYAFVLLGIASLVVVAIFLRYQRLVGKVVMLLLLTCAPFCAFTFAYSLYGAANAAKLQDRPNAPRLARGAGPRVLWIIFDEWDKRITFDDRSPKLAMPQIDRLRKESIFAENALPPAGMTLISMPAFIEGRRVRAEKRVGPDTLMVTYDNGKTQPFGAKPNLFSEVRESGINAAIVGWFLPYCRVLNTYITDCWWQELAFRWNSYGNTFHDAFLNQPRSLFETARFSPFGQSLPTLKQVRTFEQTFQRSKRLAVDNDVRFALFHFNVPHPPFFYNPQTGQLSGDSLTAYTNGVALVDRVVGELRAAMEQSGAWNTTTLLISSDHFYRASQLVNGKRDERVPFIVHLPGQTSGLTYTHSFNTVVTHDFILALLRSEITDPASVEHWLDRHNSD